MAQNKSKSKFLLAFVVIAALSPFEAIAGAPNPLGVNAANAFLSAHTPTMGSIKSNISNNMPANAASLQSASNAAKNAGSNPSLMQNPTTFKYATNMMKAANSTSGQCDVTDARNYCEKAVWTSTKSVTKTLTGLGAGATPTLALCKANVTPPAPFTNANLINATGNLNGFSGTITCSYTKPSTTGATAKTFTNLSLDGSAFITTSTGSKTTTLQSTVKLTQSQVDGQCKLKLGYTNSYLYGWAAPNGMTYTSGTVTSWK